MLLQFTHPPNLLHSHRTDTTLLEFAIPFWESFLLLLIAAQIVFTSLHLRQLILIGKQLQVHT